jgi:acyl carrier protein
MVSGEALEALVRRVVAETLVVDADRVQPDTALIAGLGAESIDFLDLMFRLEEELGVVVPFDRWSRYLAIRFPAQPVEQSITASVVREFAETVLREAATSAQSHGPLGGEGRSS